MTHTNDGGPAILPMPRARHIVYGELLAAEKWYWSLTDMAADFNALDVRPWLVNTTTMECERIGTFELPAELTTALNDAARSVAMLRYELAERAK